MVSRKPFPHGAKVLPGRIKSSVPWTPTEAGSVAAPASGVQWQETEWRPIALGDGTEVAFVECQQIVGAISLGEHDQGCVGETDVQVSVPLYEAPRRVHIVSAERGQHVRAAGHLIQQPQLSVDADPGREQVVQLSQNEWRQQSRRFRITQADGCNMVQALAPVDGREHSRGVEDDHCSPKPRNASSTWPARSDTPLSNRGS